MPLREVHDIAYQHRVTRVSQQYYAPRVVDPFVQGSPIHQAPAEGRLDESEQLADPVPKC